MTLVIVTSVMSVAAPAFAAVNDPPQGGHSITAFPARDMVEASGYEDGDELTIRLLRNGVVIGEASGVAEGDDPVEGAALEVNHPGGVCWDGHTPQLQAGDLVQVLDSNNLANGDATTIADVVVTQPATHEGGGTVTVKGTARDAAGNRLPLGQLESRIINPGFTNTINKRRLAAPGDGALAYDAPGSTSWTATFSGLTADNVARAVAGESRILWLGRDPLAENELTIYEVGDEVEHGPGMPGCPAAAAYAVTSIAPSTINVAAAGQDVVVSGTSNDATAVSVTLGTLTQAASVTPATGTQTWTATFPAADVGTLPEGTLTASGSYTVEGVPLTGATRTVLKDTVAPEMPTATPPAGAYQGAQAVTLSAEAGASIHFTTNGTDPTPASPQATGQIQITASQTLRAIAVDQAGNVSPVATFAYEIGPIGAPTAVPATASPTTLTYGASATISGRLTRTDTGAGLGRRAVELQIRSRRADNTWGAWSTIAATTTANTGTVGAYSFSHATRRNSQYRVRFAGQENTLLAVTSAARGINVRPSVTSALSTTSMGLGSTARLTGKAAPNLAGRTVRLQQRRADGTWATIASKALTSTSGYSFAIKPTRRGTYRYRVIVPAAPPYVQGASPARTLKVT
jgi:hypothetical protein